MRNTFKAFLRGLGYTEMTVTGLVAALALVGLLGWVMDACTR